MSDLAIIAFGLVMFAIGFRLGWVCREIKSLLNMGQEP